MQTISKHPFRRTEFQKLREDAIVREGVVELAFGRAERGWVSIRGCNPEPEELRAGVFVTLEFYDDPTAIGKVLTGVTLWHPRTN